MIIRTTEQESHYKNLEKKSTAELIASINKEDQKVALAIEKIIPSITDLVEAVTTKMETGGRLFYLGAGTSGRLGVLDASECPPTYGVPAGWVVGLIAGGDRALRFSIENAEDDPKQGWKDLAEHNINENDFVVGIAASGTTPYVVNALKDCKAKGILTGAISCNENAPICEIADYPITCVVGPEFVTGSTRMKSGTAQKMILNMITTSTMIKLGKVKGNRMVDMQLSNAKLIQRAIDMVAEITGLDQEKSSELLSKTNNVREAVALFYNSGK